MMSFPGFHTYFGQSKVSPCTDPDVVFGSYIIYPPSEFKQTLCSSEIFCFLGIVAIIHDDDSNCGKMLIYAQK